MDENRLKMIIEVLDFNKLNDWEIDFLVSIEDQFLRRGLLSKKQEDKIEDMFRKGMIEGG